MSGDASLPAPSVLWAQSNNTIFLTICLEDCENPTLTIKNTHVYFRGIGGIADRKEYEVNIELYKEIIPEKSKKVVSGRTIELALQKKEPGPSFWPHLTKLKEKYHWLKIDFNKWKEEDDTDTEVNDMDGFDENNFYNMMNLDRTAEFDSDNESDSDDLENNANESLPPLE